LFGVRAPIAVGIVLAFYTVLVRWPYREVIGADESFFLIVAHQWVLGLPPYVGAFDVKPPGLFAIVALAETLFGPTFETIKALEAAAVAATSVALWTFGRRHLNARVGLLAGLFYAPASLVLSGVTSPTELLASAFVTLAVLIGWGTATAGQPRLIGWTVAGLLMGVAISVKQPAVFEAAAFCLAVLARPSVARSRAVVAFALGCAAVPAAFAAFYLGGGHFTDLLNDAVLAALGRIKGDGLTWMEAVRRTPAMLKPVVLLVGAAALAWAERRRLRGSPQWPTIRLLAIWLAGALAGILAVKSMYDHYFLTLLPPLSLLAAVGLDTLPIRAPRWRWAAKAALICATVAVLVSRSLPLIEPASSQLVAERQAAASLRAFGLKAEDRILVLGDLGVYLLAHAEPATSIFHPQQMLCAFPRLGGSDPLAAALASRPAFVVMPAPDFHMVCEMEARQQEIAAVLASDYCPLARSDRFTVEGLRNELTIYGRRAQFAAACARRASGLQRAVVPTAGVAID
jgi:4-amino-4-deoxy-L-arabinose transferase-like glycosyltransferase